MQIINNLIANNGLQATPDAPETWEFATWNNENPKQIIELKFTSKEMYGNASFVGLVTLQKLYCNRLNDMTGILNEIDVTNCTQLQILDCNSMGPLYKLNLTNCTQLQSLNCYQCHLTELDLKDCTQLQILNCSRSALTKLDLAKCKQLQTLNCSHAYLTKLCLIGLDNLTHFNGSEQRVYVTLFENETGEYTCPISLNNPTFGNSAISYSSETLKSTDNTVSSTSFTVQTGKAGYELSGEMKFNYSEVGINTIDEDQLNVYPNPNTGELRIEIGELKIKNIEIYDVNGSKQKIASRRQQAESEIVIDISHLPAGIYFVKVITGQGEVIKKIVKQ